MAGLPPGYMTNPQRVGFSGTEAQFRGIVHVPSGRWGRMGRIYEREGTTVWWADYVDTEGVRQRVSTGTRDKEEARRFLKKREGAVAVGEPILPRQDRVSFAEIKDN